MYAACFGVGEEEEDLPPKSLLELADEPEFNEEISRLVEFRSSKAVLTLSHIWQVSAVAIV